MCTAKVNATRLSIITTFSIRLNCFGEDHPDGADSYNDIGNLYKDKGEFDRASNLFNKSLRIKLNFLGENHIDSAASFTNLGYICAMQGHFKKAYEFHHKALATLLEKRRENNKVSGHNAADKTPKYEMPLIFVFGVLWSGRAFFVLGF